MSVLSDRERFDSLLKPILDSAYRVALRMTRNSENAWDLVHDAVLNAFKGFSHFEPGTNFKAWFFKILTNTFIRKYSKTKLETVSLDVGEAPDLFLFSNTRHQAPAIESGVDPLTTVLEKIDEQKVNEAIERLPEEYRMACSLYLLEDLSYQEIADILGVPIGTVRSRIHRGRNLLQHALWDLIEEDNDVEKVMH